jgi:hypothetical protein
MMMRRVDRIKNTHSTPFPLTIDHTLLKEKGQVILEFTFCMLIVMLMVFGITKVLIWSGRDFAGRNEAHTKALTRDIVKGYKDIGDGPLNQINPYFYTPVKMNAVWEGP